MLYLVIGGKVSSMHISHESCSAAGTANRLNAYKNFIAASVLALGAVDAAAPASAAASPAPSIAS